MTSIKLPKPGPAQLKALHPNDRKWEKLIDGLWREYGSLAGKEIETIPRNDKDCLVWDETKQKYVHEQRSQQAYAWFIS